MCAQQHERLCFTQVSEGFNSNATDQDKYTTQTQYKPLPQERLISSITTNTLIREDRTHSY